MLTDTEVMELNNVLAELYMCDSFGDMTQRFFCSLSNLIMFDKCYAVLLNKDRTVQEKTVCGFREEDIETLYSLDYFKNLYHVIYKAGVIRDSELSSALTENSQLKKSFLPERNLRFGCGIIFFREQEVIGMIRIFRNELLGDFSARDLFILNMLKIHLEHLYLKISGNPGSKLKTEKEYLVSADKYDLTKREKEVFTLLCEGMTNKEISDRLIISMSTVKKHIYGIYSKMNINSRVQLAGMLAYH